MESIKKRKRIICATAIALIVLAIAYVWYWRSQPSGENLNYAYPESIESVRDLTPILSDLIEELYGATDLYVSDIYLSIDSDKKEGRIQFNEGKTAKPPTIFWAYIDLNNKIVKSIHAHSYHSKLYDKPILNYMEWAVDETDALQIAKQVACDISSTSIYSTSVHLIRPAEIAPYWRACVKDKYTHILVFVSIDPMTGKILEVDTSELKDR